MGRTKKATSSGDDVVPPKRPMTGYMLFSNDNRAKVKEKHPNVKGAAQVAKILGEMWSKAGDSVKKSYQSKYEAAKKKYDKEMEQFKKDNPDFQATRKRKAAAGKQEKGAKGKKAKKDPNAPKRPMTPFFMYSQEFREEVRKENPDVKNTDVSKILSEQWKELSDAEKKKYQDRFQREKAEYAKKVAAYEKQKKEESEEEEVVESEEEEEDSDEGSEESDEGSDEESDDE